MVISAVSNRYRRYNSPVDILGIIMFALLLGAFVLYLIFGGGWWGTARLGRG